MSYLFFLIEKSETGKFELSIQGDQGKRNGQYNLQEVFDSMEKLEQGVKKFTELIRRIDPHVQVLKHYIN